MVLCNICFKNDEATYKCPICRVPYCTVQCFKLHKESTCEKIKAELVDEASNSKEANYSHKTADTISEDILKLLDNDKELQRVLSNKHVRDILMDIDGCDKPNEMVEQAMKEPIFIEFADACLQVLERNKD